MPLGWIDFSKSERNKILSILDRLSEKETLDELGIAPVRDGFANIFFPGTSTIQTRAKYFLIVPYALKDLERSDETNPNKVLREFDEIEMSCAQKLLDNGSDAERIIGSRSLNQGKWVKRTPADIYWAGLRNYEIFTGGTLSLTEYIRAFCALKKQKTSLKSLGSRNDNFEETEGDDKDAGGLFKKQFWNILDYSDKWMDDLEIKLTSSEGEFLKQQIIQSFPESMMAFILKNNMTELLESEDFASLDSLIHLFPVDIQNDYRLARKFSDFIYVVRTIYNIILSNGENQKANSEWTSMRDNLKEYSDVDLEAIFTRLQLFNNPNLCNFLRNEKSSMLANDLEEMKNEIRKRERYLKGNRARTMHPGEFDTDAWYGGGTLGYRYSNAKIIMHDIFESEGLYA